MGHRQFARVKEITQLVNDRLRDRMPLIPLWQLDTHMVVHPRLHPTRIDPLTTFDDVSHWKLDVP